MVETYWCPCCLTDWFRTIPNALYRIDKPNGSIFPTQICIKCIELYTMDEIKETIKKNMTERYDSDADEMWNKFRKTFDEVQKNIKKAKELGLFDDWKKEYYKWVNKR